MSTDLEEMVHEYEAIRRWNAGEIPSFSSDVGEFLTCGYGNLDGYGNWQFPLYPAELYLSRLKKRLTSTQKSV